MKKILLIALLALLQTTGKSQTDSLPNFNQLNQTNKSGEKTGWWIVYLDHNLKQLNDSIGATHCMYNYYTGKFYHYKFGMNGLGSKKFPVHFPENESSKSGSFNLLHGNYNTYYASGEMRCILSASNGILTEYKEYYPSGQLHLDFSYSVECGAPIRTCLKEYDKDGNLKYNGPNWVPQDSKKNQ